MCRGFVISEDFTGAQFGPAGSWKVYGLRGSAGVFYPAEFILNLGDDLFVTVGGAATISLLISPYTPSISTPQPL